MIGKVLDASALAAFVQGSIAADAWFATVRVLSRPLYLPLLALTEVRAVRPDTGPELADLLAHPSIVLGELDSATAREVDQLLTAVGVFDVLAGHVVHIARQRGWPALSADPGRLYRVDSTLAVDAL